MPELTEAARDTLQRWTRRLKPLLGELSVACRARPAGSSRHADQVLERELFRKHGWNWIGQRLELEPADGDITRVATHDPRSENTQHYDAVLRHLGAEPVLVGCDGTAGEVQRYEASLHLREPAAQQ